MPLFEMPLEKMLDYEGTNPKPQDHEAYWERALSQMRALGTGCELAPAAFRAPGVECFDLWFTGVWGARVYAKLLVPRGGGKRPALCRFHGYSGDSGDWAHHLGYAQAGFVVAAMDCRGQGGKSEDVGGVKGNTLSGQIIRGLDDPDPDRLLTRALFLDAAQLARIVMDMPGVDETRVGALGGSQGGALTLACAALEPRVARLAPVYPFMCDYERVWRMDLAVDAYKELKEYFRKFDPQHKREREVFTRLGYVDLQHLAHRIRGETMMCVGLMDTIGPPSTQFAAYNKISAPKRYELWPD
ncbi:MAG TPA: acetylxylan esterase, partial [Candidatus Limnocylindria bacterium]|nr:acetylxylan esterase [Candidatus Limnocylindria bacterium]